MLRHENSSYYLVHVQSPHPCQNLPGEKINRVRPEGYYANLHTASSVVKLSTLIPTLTAYGNSLAVGLCMKCKKCLQRSAQVLTNVTEC